MDEKRNESLRHSHLKLLWGWVVYFALFFFTERLIPPEQCYVVHSWLDDVIPFHEVFLIPYVGWYFLVISSLVYFMWHNVSSFKRLQIYIIITQAVGMLIYILLPTRQDLRPIEFPRDNILTRGVEFLYSIDTNTNVCPSMHVAYSLAIASVWLKENTVSRAIKAFIVVFVILVCMSTVFLKQHSALDFFAACAVCMLAEGLIFGRSHWLPRLRALSHDG